MAEEQSTVYVETAGEQDRRQYKTTIPKDVAENWFFGGVEKGDKLIWKQKKGRIVIEKA